MSIYVITKRDKIKTVLERYEKQYENYEDKYVLYDGSTPRKTKEALRKLDLNTCSEQDVINILNGSWTALKCQECRKNVGKVIHIGDDDEFDNSVVLLCEDCLNKVNKAFNEN